MLQYTGDILESDAAEKLNIVSKTFPHDELIESTLSFAQTIAQGATYSMSLIKKLIYRSLDTDLAESLRLAGPAQNLARRSHDHKEGIKSFVEKRSPNFIGR